jgi:hypothetical protein
MGKVGKDGTESCLLGEVWGDIQATGPNGGNPKGSFGVAGDSLHVPFLVHHGLFLSSKSHLGAYQTLFSRALPCHTLQSDDIQCLETLCHWPTHNNPSSQSGIM